MDRCWKFGYGKITHSSYQRCSGAVPCDYVDTYHSELEKTTDHNYGHSADELFSQIAGVYTVGSRWLFKRLCVWNQSAGTCFNASLFHRVLPLRLELPGWWRISLNQKNVFLWWNFRCTEYHAGHPLDYTFWKSKIFLFDAGKVIIHLYYFMGFSSFGPSGKFEGIEKIFLSRIHQCSSCGMKLIRKIQTEKPENICGNAWPCDWTCNQTHWDSTGKSNRADYIVCCQRSFCRHNVYDIQWAMRVLQAYAEGEDAIWNESDTGRTGCCQFW